MPKAFTQSPKTAASETAAIYALWDAVNAAPVHNTDETLALLAAGLQQILRADNIKWLAAARVLSGEAAAADPLSGWRLRGSYDLVEDPPEYRKFIAWWYQRNNKIAPQFQLGDATLALIAETGRFRVHRMRDGWIPYPKFRRSEHYELHYTKLGITDRMWIACPINPDAESVFLVDRMGNSPRFTKREAELAELILRPLGPFLRRLYLDRGLLVGDNALSPMPRRVLRCLLTGLPEKAIAESLGLSPGTVHQYVKTIYEHFGVNGRAALLAIWVGA